ncbi:MAG: RluA family pseudouridine synthase [Actinomycetota bacterium]|nr:RluA family pseudouridine synthase [Actinomycetota bacterium]MDH5223785.1 RluA family pseudouridine synthase [Actinomycetota bacterium]MDH5312931.1 RluA family pseudouridine synthase [Actinomycetota bacterium]
MSTETFVAEAGRLDAVIARLAGVSRADAQRAIADGAVLVDGRARAKSHTLRGGERIQIDLRAQEALAAEGPAVPVRFEDEHLVVIAKPAGLITHPTAQRRTGTLVNRLLGMGIPLSSAGGELRPGIVHRLDAGTSGLMLVAKTDETHQALADMMRAHSVERRYLVLVRGQVEHDTFVVDAPLGRRAERIVVDRSEGRAADTGFHVRERLARGTLLVAVPGTGRTHQIRVHLQAIDHPVLGDRAYGGGGHDATALELSRPFLHSWRIGFDHPFTAQRVEIEEPLPSDLASALDRARRTVD